MQKATEIGAYETKTRLAAFLREVQAGARFTITQCGRPVAELVPYGSSRRNAKPEAARQMQAFMRKQTSTEAVNIKASLEEGRD